MSHPLLWPSQHSGSPRPLPPPLTGRGFAVALCLLLLAACGRAAQTPQSAFDGRVRDWTAEILRESPETATSAGLGEDIAGRGFSARLDDRSVAAFERRRTAAERRYVELHAMAQDDLNAEERITYAALEAQFRAAAGAARFSYGNFSQLGGVSPYALNQLDSAYLDLPDFFDTRQAIANFADAEIYLTRLAAAPAAIDGDTERARADAEAGVIPPDFIIDRTLANLDAMIGTPAGAQMYVVALRNKLAPLAPATAPPADQQRAQAMITRAETITRDRITPAMQRAAAALRAMRPRATSDAGIWRLPEGPAYYRAALAIQTMTDLTPDQIHQIGLTRVAELTQELDITLRRLGHAQGTVGARLSALTADPQYAYPETEEGRAQLLADVRARIDRVMQMAPRWFQTMPRAPLEIRRTPAAAEASSFGAYYEGPSLDGATPGIYYINLRDLSEMTKIDLPTQDYHEAAPGHHFQVARARERADLPLLRRLISFNSYAEGWGLYAEQLADEQNLYADDPIGRVGYLRWQLWRAARLVVDTGIHEKRWTRQQAIDYLQQVTGDAPGVIVSEVERYVVWPGQACSYEIGRREISALREEARNRLGPRFDLRGFHESVLHEGELPWPALRPLVRAWIAERATQP